MTDRTAAPAAVCLGEGMVMLASADGSPLAQAEVLRRSAGGAECNVAGGLAALGVAATWVSRLGSDPFGDFLATDLAERGVRVLAECDPDRPTGVYVKEQTAGGSRMQYYRAGSAASAITAGLFDVPDIAEALAITDLVHTSGITAGIVAEPDGLLAELEARRATHGFLLSVDLNWRPVLWRGRDLGPLRRLLAAADLLLLGQDEALACLGTDGLDAVRQLVGARPTIVLKSDSHVATAQTPDGQITEVPALTVDVVEPIGAGDGFAAGFLAARLEGRPMSQCLRAGHLVAASVLSVRADHAPPPPVTIRAALLASSDADWSATRIGPAGIDSPVLSAVLSPVVSPIVSPAHSPVLAEDTRLR